MTTKHIISLAPRTENDAEPRARVSLENSRKALGFIPNMYANMANSPILLDSYSYAYALFRQESGFTPMEQEVVFLTISRVNGCRYCVAAHSFVADTMSKVPPEVTDAIRERRDVPDRKLQALSVYTSIVLHTRGYPDMESTATFLAAGYTERHILDIVQALAVKTMSNYANHLFGTELDAIFTERSWLPT